MIDLELERVEALEMLAMTLAHLRIAEESGEVSPRVPMLLVLRDTLVAALEDHP